MFEMNETITTTTTNDLFLLNANKTKGLNLTALTQIANKQTRANTDFIFEM